MMGRRLIGYAWASPWTLAGCLAIPLALATGGRVAVHTGVIEISGGLFGWLLPRIGPGAGIAAVTIGHCVLATDEPGLRGTRAHERVHVAQFERWGPLFPFLYTAASLEAWLRGTDYYLDNRYEVEARRLTS
ncbi:MAG: hypothetical protein ACKVZ0_01580 [Gemmatimonadales bacterium]